MKRCDSPPLTAELAGKIKYLLSGGLYQHQVASVLGINQGRVSEVKNGKRFKEEPPDDQTGFDFG